MTPDVPDNRASPPPTLFAPTPAAVVHRQLPVSEHTIETEIFALIRDLDSLQKQQNDILSENSSVKSTLSLEMKVREAAETTCADLEKEKQRLLKNQLASYEQAAQQLDYATKYANSMQALKEMQEKLASNLKEHEMKVATLCAGHEAKEEEIGKQIIEMREDAASRDRAVACLEQQLAQSITPDIFNQKLQEAQQRLHDKYLDELEDLKMKLKREEMNNQKLQADLQEAQQSLMSSRVKYDDQLREVSANRHADVFKQKVMKLRKDNEMLRRQLQNTVQR